MTNVVPKKVEWDNLDVPVWQRLPGETSRAFFCWQAYRDLPNADRNLERAADELGVSATSLREHYVRWHWKRRLEAWENYLSDIAVKQQIEAAAGMNRRHIETARTMLEKVMLRLTGREPDEKGRGAIEALPIEKLSASDVSRMVDAASKLERLAMEAESLRLGVTQEEQRDEVVIRLAFDATPQMPGGKGSPLPVFHGPDDDVVDADAVEVNEELNP